MARRKIPNKESESFCEFPLSPLDEVEIKNEDLPSLISPSSMIIDIESVLVTGG